MNMISEQPEKRIELVHMQLTSQCNLRCYFCGQWGEKGCFSNNKFRQLEFADWQRVIDSLTRYRDKTGFSPDIILWGGEPLVSPEFVPVTELLIKRNFNIGMVTNGVLLDRHTEIIRKHFSKVYVSVDGNRELHDKIRGEGVFDKVSKNVHLLQGGKPQIEFLTVVSPDNVDFMLELPHMMEPLSPDRITLQRLIYLNTQEYTTYSKWLKECFGQNAETAKSWINDDTESYLEKLNEKLPVLQQKIANGEFSCKVEYLPHGLRAKNSSCLAPFRRIHIAANGNIGYCTDFFDFSAGNVVESDVIDIFNNELSETYRKEILRQNNPCCDHCSWRNSTNFHL